MKYFIEVDNLWTNGKELLNINHIASVHQWTKEASPLKPEDFKDGTTISLVNDIKISTYELYACVLEKIHLAQRG